MGKQAPPVSKTAKANTQYLDFLAERLGVLGEITHRAMMGGHVFYCNGVVFALAASGELYLKTDSLNKPEFEAAGMKPFKPFPGKDGVMTYYAAPPEVFEHDDAVRKWAGSSVSAGQRAAKKKRSK